MSNKASEVDKCDYVITIMRTIMSDEHNTVGGRKTINVMSCAILDMDSEVLKNEWFTEIPPIEAAFSRETWDFPDYSDFYELEREYALEHRFGEILSISDDVTELALCVDPDLVLAQMMESKELVKVMIGKKFVESVKTFINYVCVEAKRDESEQKFILRFLKKAYEILPEATKDSNCELLGKLLPKLTDETIKQIYMSGRWYELGDDKLREELHRVSVTKKCNLDVKYLVERRHDNKTLVAAANRLIKLGFTAQSPQTKEILESNKPNKK